MMASQKYIFLYALILTLVVFSFGIYMGYVLESSRITQINEMYLQSELELLDQGIQEDMIDAIGLDCNSLVEENIKFADKVYEEALLIKEFEDANKINQDIIFQHERFDLLRTLFWMKSIKIKEKCNSDYHTVVYFYEYINPSIEQEGKQRFFSNLLYQLKQKHANKIMLIPIAADKNIPSIDLLLKKYKIDELPAIMIDEKVEITEVQTLEDIEKYLN